jgi:hypothetical protein
VLNYEKIKQYFTAGLDEIIISMHGCSKEIYETMMPGAKLSTYIKFLAIFQN